MVGGALARSEFERRAAELKTELAHRDRSSVESETGLTIPCLLGDLEFDVLLCRLVLQHGGTGQNAPADENAHDADGDNKSSAHVFTSGPALTRGWLTSGKGASPFLLRQARLYSCCWK